MFMGEKLGYIFCLSCDISELDSFRKKSYSCTGIFHWRGSTESDVNDLECPKCVIQGIALRWPLGKRKSTRCVVAA